MRKIKFRAWEKNLKEIIPIQNIDFENRMVNTESAWRLFNEVELMQYTGLKDKNGKEIFEGDIVSSKNNSGSDNSNVDVVKFINGRFVIHDPDKMLDDMWINDTDLYDIEVIGNIYENPELLEGGR